MKMFRRPTKDEKGGKPLQSKKNVKSFIMEEYKKGTPKTVMEISKELGIPADIVEAEANTLIEKGDVILYEGELYPYKVIFDEGFLEAAGQKAMSLIDEREEWYGAGFDIVEILDDLGMDYKGALKVMEYLVRKGELTK